MQHSTVVSGLVSPWAALLLQHQHFRCRKPLQDLVRSRQPNNPATYNCHLRLHRIAPDFHQGTSSAAVFIPYWQPKTGPRI